MGSCNKVWKLGNHALHFNLKNGYEVTNWERVKKDFQQDVE